LFLAHTLAHTNLASFVNQVDSFLTQVWMGGEGGK
jgi:hypothetical protein